MADGKRRRPAGKAGKATKATKATRAPKSGGAGAAGARRTKAGGAGATAKAAARSGSGGTTRVDRLEAARRERRRKAALIRLVLSGAALVVLGVILFAGRGKDPAKAALTSGPGGCSFDTRFDGTAANQSDHVDHPTYEGDPPAGGPHEPTAAAPGFYDTTNVPSDGKLVHAQEHGFVVLWHRPDLGDATNQEIQALSDRFGRELIVVPRASLKGEIAVTAWHKRLLCKTLDADAVATFTNTYKDKGPEKGFL